MKENNNNNNNQRMRENINFLSFYLQLAKNLKSFARQHSSNIHMYKHCT